MESDNRCPILELREAAGEEIMYFGDGKVFEMAELLEIHERFMATGVVSDEDARKLQDYLPNRDLQFCNTTDSMMRAGESEEWVARVLVGNAKSDLESEAIRWGSNCVESGCPFGSVVQIMLDKLE